MDSHLLHKPNMLGLHLKNNSADEKHWVAPRAFLKRRKTIERSNCHVWLKGCKEKISKIVMSGKNTWLAVKIVAKKRSGSNRTHSSR